MPSASSLWSLLLAEIIFIGVAMLLFNAAKPAKKRKTHKEALQIFVSETVGPKTDFEENRDRYIQAVKEGRYRTKDLACRDLYDNDEEFYRCLEEVYFSQT
jgi:hypothetical protein